MVGLETEICMYWYGQPLDRLPPGPSSGGELQRGAAVGAQAARGAR